MVNAERNRDYTKYVDDARRRHVTFSRRKSSLIRKGEQLSLMTGASVMVIIQSENGRLHMGGWNGLKNMALDARMEARVKRHIARAGRSKKRTDAPGNHSSSSSEAD